MKDELVKEETKMVRLTPLSDIADIVGGYAFKGSDFGLLGAPVVKIANIEPPRVNIESCQKIPIGKLSGLERFRLVKGDILMAMTGATVGKVGRLRDDQFAYLNQRVAKISSKLGPEYDDFIFALLSQKGFEEKILNNSSGSAQANVSADGIGRVLVPMLEPPKQLKAGKFIAALDDKIDLNRRINQTLEAMAQAIFKSWFVDFDPVKAKIAAIEQGQDPLRAAMRAISGKTDAELDQMPREHHDQLAATAALFPDAMEESELGDIPKGWRSEAIGCYFDLTMGQSPPGNTYNETGEGMPFYQGRTDFGVRFPTERVYCTAPTRLAKKGDVLVSVRAPVGDINVAVSDCAIGRGVAAVRYEHPSFALYVLRHQGPAFKRFESDGTVFGSINKKQFESLPFVVAPDELVRRFQSLVGPLDEKIENNEWKMRNLAILRDTLLPKLLSGELSVDHLSAEAETT